MNKAAPRWRKLGKLFDPRDHKLPLGCQEFAQSPQVLINNDAVRIYFSTRSVDQDSGKFLSQVCYVDFDANFQTIQHVSNQAVLPLGELGCFDEHGIFPLNVVRVGDRVYGYTCGWSRRHAVSVETGIGLAISHDDGATFTRLGPGPVLSSSLHEPCLVGDGFVKFFAGRFHMWYIYGRPWKQFANSSEAERIYKIAHATSDDGVQWTRSAIESLIDDSIGDDECQALPTVIENDGRYHMYFCYRYASDFRTNPDRGYRLGYAYSDDLASWTRDDANVGIHRSTDPTDWDHEMMCYPHVFRFQDKLYLLYNGNAFGRHGFGLAVAE